MTRRLQTTDFLRRQSASHLPDAFLNATFEWHGSFDGAAAHADGIQVESKQIELRIDAARDDGPFPAPLDYATLGTNFRDDDGLVHILGGDIDADDHKAGHDPSILDRILDKLSQLDWLQINRSRGGKGYHFYAMLGHPVQTKNNSEVYALGADLVQQIATEIDEPDFADFVDKCGSIMFVWSNHRKPDSYRLLKAATGLYLGKLEPYYPAPKGARSGITAEHMDADHKRLVDWLQANHQRDFYKSSCEGVLYQIHTLDIAAAHKALNLRGTFTTDTSGSTSCNGWLVLLPGGEALVGRWGHNESTWKQSGGNCYTTLNPQLKLADYAESLGLLPAPDGSYFLTVDEAQAFCADNRQPFTDPGTSSVIVNDEPAGIRFTAAVKEKDEVPAPWRRVSPRKAVYAIRKPQAAQRLDPSDSIRICFSQAGKGIHPFRRVHRKLWIPDTIENIKAALYGWHDMNERDIARFVTTDTPYELVNEPFRPEFLSKYQWNRGAVQLAFEPAAEPGEYPHWQMILDHVGHDFDEPVANDLWCQENGIKTGADLIKLWDARVLRAPKERLIGLSLISTHQNCGKSIQFSKFQILLSRGGYVLAEKALTTNFTWPLMGALLCDLDDVDLSQKDGAIYQKLQPLMTNDTLVIEGKGSNVVQTSNCTHWGHSANRPECCPVQDGDTRFIIAEVGPLVSEVPRMTMDRHLIAEAPNYLRALFALVMPKEPAGRLYLPPLDTPIKRRLMASRASGKLTDEQNTWLDKFQALADANKLRELTPFSELAKLMGTAAPLNAESLTHVWARLSVVLEGRGYKTANRKRTGVKHPAAWSVYRQ